MDGVNELNGFFGDGFHKDKHLLWLQTDRYIKHVAYGTGYPQVNDVCGADDHGPRNKPWNGPAGRSKTWLVNDPVGDDVTYHELGHEMKMTYYRGETEAIVNFNHVYIRNVKEGVGFDKAFAESMGTRIHEGQFTPDLAAVHWMITKNFRTGREMDYSNSQYNEFRYQHRGYAKYADIARTFGWGALKAFNRQDNLDVMAQYLDVMAQSKSANVTFDWLREALQPFKGAGSDLGRVDGRTLRMSIAAGADLTVLIHFWGIHPENIAKLKCAMQHHGLSPSNKIRKLLERYKSLIPMDKKAFLKTYHKIYPKNPTKCRSRLYGCGWWKANKNWNRAAGQASVSQVDKIIAAYYNPPSPTPKPTHVSTPVTTTTTTQACRDGDVRTATGAAPVEGVWLYPEIFYAGTFYPICGHYFWDNNYGASTFCRHLGFKQGERRISRATFPKDSIGLGRCHKTDRFPLCTAGGNSWSNLKIRDCWCCKGRRIGVQVRCSGAIAPVGVSCLPE
jgi:hypothetical protein